MIRVSAILCTHNPREEYLRRVLESLQNQTLPGDSWELLLVDNGSKLTLSSCFDLAWHPHGRHVREDELGLTPARLRGIKESVADILVFVDDDTVLAANYLEQVLTVGTEWPFVGTWGGSVIPEYERPLPDWVGEQVWRLTVADVREDVWSNLRDSFTTFPCGAGLCLRRSVGQAYLERCRSNRQIAISDRKGNSLTGYGDMDLCHSALDLGLGTGKSARLRLTHLIPAGRLTLDYFVRHAEGDAMSLMLFRASRGLPVRRPNPKSLVDSLRWFLHRQIRGVSREQYEIAKAHQRGLERGWTLIQEQRRKMAAG